MDGSFDCSRVYEFEGIGFDGIITGFNISLIANRNIAADDRKVFPPDCSFIFQVDPAGFSAFHRGQFSGDGAVRPIHNLRAVFDFEGIGLP